MRDPSRMLEILRAGFVAETVAEARVRLAAERPRDTRTLAEAAGQRLAELRALDELARYVRRR